MSRERTNRVTADELKGAIMKMISEHFEGRELDIDTVRRALEMTASELVFIHLKAVATR